MVDTQGKKSKVLLSPLSSSFLFSRRCLSRAFSLNKVHCVFVCLTESHPSPVPGRSIITVALPSLHASWCSPHYIVYVFVCVCLSNTKIPPPPLLGNRSLHQLSPFQIWNKKLGMCTHKQRHTWIRLNGFFASLNELYWGAWLEHQSQPSFGDYQGNLT